MDRGSGVTHQVKTSDWRVCAERGFAESDLENLHLSKAYKIEMFLHEAHCINF